MIEPVTDPEILEGYNTDALGYRGAPEGLFRPADEAEVRDILAWASAERRAVTPVGLRSSTTGSCVAPSGYLLSLERFQSPPDIRPDTRTAVVQPGLNLAQLKAQLEAHGLFFPPDPTSEPDCCIGGAVATNASGARSLKYGAIRNWVRRLRVLLASGEALELHAAAVDKNAAGYYGFQDPIQFFIGCEGTLGVITEIELRCLPLPADYLSLYAFYPDEAAALAAAAAFRESAPGVRCLEYFDGGSLALIRDEKGAAVPGGAGGMLFIEEEAPAGGVDALLEAWLERLEGSGALVDDTMVGDTRARKEEMKALRHAIPSTLNERGIRCRGAGGGKVSTDWAVHHTRIAAMFPAVRAICRAHGLDEVYGYGHIGNGHPHFNIVAADADAKARAKAAVHEMCRLVQAAAGTVSAEHGIGKVKKEFLPYCFPPQAIEWMRAFKREMDPALVLAPGNIFDF